MAPPGSSPGASRTTSPVLLTLQEYMDSSSPLLRLNLWNCPERLPSLYPSILLATMICEFSLPLPSKRSCPCPNFSRRPVPSTPWVGPEKTEVKYIAGCNAPKVSLSAGALRYRAWAQSWSSAALATGISAFPLGWPWEAQSSPRVARESWGWRSSHCRA